MRLASPDAIPTTGEPNLINRLESEIQNETGIFSTSPSKMVRVSIDDDLFGSIKVKPRLKSDSDEDLFASTKPKPVKPGDSLFATSSKPPQPPSQPTASNVFDSPPEDVFAPSPGSRQAAVGADDIFASSKAATSGNLDELLGSTSKKGTVRRAGVEETDTGKVPFAC